MKNITWLVILSIIVIIIGVLLSQTSNKSTPDSASNTSKNYVAYSEQAITEAHERGDTVALFFHAPWCPDCRALNSEIEAKGVPEGITIVKTDYDSQTELRQKYGVTTQHTIVQIDKNNDKVNLWRGLTLDDILSNLTPTASASETIETMIDKDTTSSTQPGTYTEYSEQAVAQAHERGDTVALFFHAPWCPDCRALNSEIESKGVPSGVTIIKTDFDSQTELRQKYGVTTQHTIVEIDMNNDKVNLWRGLTLDDIITNLNS